MTAKNILKKLGDELGHIGLIADWVKKEMDLLGEEIEQVFDIKEPELCGHGAGEIPGGVPVDPATIPPQPPVEAPAEGEAIPAAADTAAAASAPDYAPDANAASVDSGEVTGDGNTAQSTTSAPLPDVSAAVPEDVTPADGGNNAS